MKWSLNPLVRGKRLQQTVLWYSLCTQCVCSENTLCFLSTCESQLLHDYQLIHTNSTWWDLYRRRIVWSLGACLETDAKQQCLPPAAQVLFRHAWPGRRMENSKIKYSACFFVCKTRWHVYAFAILLCKLYVEMHTDFHNAERNLASASCRYTECSPLLLAWIVLLSSWRNSHLECYRMSCLWFLQSSRFRFL